MERGYEFAEVAAPIGKRKVISLPKSVAETVRRESVQREAAPTATLHNPDSSS